MNKALEDILYRHREKDYPDNIIIYHYTSAEALIGLLESKEFWLTHYSCLNDPSEIEHALNQIIEVSKQIIRNHGITELTSSFLENIRTSVKKYYNFYVFSLCKNCDYLPAWRWYANNGAGFAVGFKGNIMVPEEIENKPIYLKCFYGEDEYKDIIEEILLTIKNKKLHLKPKDLIFPLMHLVPKIKHHGYKEEGEYRLCLIEEKDDVPNKKVCIPRERKFWRSGPASRYVNPIPMVKWPFDISSFCEIWVGPKCNYEHAKHELREMLRKNGYENVEIKKSDIPYRG